MKNKKMIALDIEKSCVKIAEIEADNSHIKMLNTALLTVSTFDSGGTLINLRNLVSEICDKLKEMEVTTKNIFLCCPFLGGEVKSLNAEKQQLTIAELLQKKPFEGGQNNGKTSFGTIKNGEQITEYFIESSTDEFLLAEFARLFSERGFYLKSAEYTATAMLNLTALSRYSYDSRSKIIVELGDSVTTTIITDHDIPIDIRHWNMDTGNIENQVTDYIIRDKMALKLKNPTVLICGTKLPESKFKEIKEELKSADVSLLDFIADCDLEPPYALCAALALKTATKSKINLLPQKTRHFLPPKLKARLKTAVSYAAAALLSFSVLLCGFSVFRLISANLAISKIPELQAQINTANTKIKMFANNAVTLKNAESKLTDFLNFISNYADTNIFIASADTENMLPQTTIKSGLVLSEEVKTDNRKLVVRGYALSGVAALDFYRELQTAGFAPQMNGIQIETLPSGETAVIFELEMIL